MKNGEVRWAVLLVQLILGLMRQSPPKSRCESLERRRVLHLAWSLPFAAIVAGCGQKGPLYHPPQSDDEEEEDDETSAAPRAPDSRPA